MKLVDSPRDRLKTVTLGLISHKSGPNVIAGIFLSAVIQAAAGFTPWWYVVLAGVAWTVSILAYAVADEVRSAIEERKNRLLDPDSEYYGIE